ncbi:hypothetical protein OROHE_019033 [Orobanche hederae]
MSNSDRESEDARSSSHASDTTSEEAFVNEPPTGCVWKRPTLHFVTRQVNLYVREAVFKEIIDTLSGMGRNSPVGDRAIERLTAGVLGRLMNVRRTGSINIALHHLIARQLEGDQIPLDESWFQVCGRTIRFTARDFAMITGLHFGNSTFHPQNDHLLRSGGLFHILLHGKNIKIISNIAMKEGQEHKDYHFYGPVWALQIWSYEMIPALGEQCGIRDKSVQVPWCLMWTTKKIFCDFTHFFDDKLFKINLSSLSSIGPR